MAGTFEQLTAETIWAPFLIMAECSALEPTMKPVTLCRKIMGTFLGWVSDRFLARIAFLFRSYIWLHWRMN